MQRLWWSAGDVGFILPCISLTIFITKKKLIILIKCPFSVKCYFHIKADGAALSSAGASE